MSHDDSCESNEKYNLWLDKHSEFLLLSVGLHCHIRENAKFCFLCVLLPLGMCTHCAGDTHGSYTRA